MKAAVYARISLDDTGEALGVARQVEDCTAKAKAMGWEVTATYVDNDVSASKAKPRPEYERLMKDLAEGTVTALVVYDLDRLTRKPAELESFIALAEQHGISLANVAGDVDLTTANGRMVARIKGAVARQEAERIGERVARQKLQRAMSGEPHKGRHRLYGYDDQWNLIPAEAAVIKEAFTRRACGESTTAIASDFTERSIMTVSGNPWKSGTLGETLTKHVYCGKVTFKGKVVADSKYEAIVDEATFNAAQANLANDSKGTNTRKYLLSGILLCEHCLAPMKGNPSNKMYRCSTTYGGCGRLSVRIEKADRWVTWAAMQKANEKPKRRPSARDFKAEAQALEDSIKRIQDGFKADIYSVDEAKRLIDADRAALKEVRKAEARAVPKMNHATQKYFDYYRSNLSQQRAFIGEHIKHVVVGPARSRGNQPFDPARFEVHYQDGLVQRISSDAHGQDIP